MVMHTTGRPRLYSKVVKWRQLTAMLASTLLGACSILGSVEGDYSLATGGGGGGRDVGGGRPWAISVNAGIEAHVTDMISRNSNVYAVGWYRGNPLRIADAEARTESSDDASDAFVVHFAPDGSVEKLAVFGSNGPDQLHGIDMLSNGDFIVVGETCAEKTFLETGDECEQATERYATAVHLAGSDFVVIKPKQFGRDGGRAVRVRIVDTTGDEGILVASNPAVSGDEIAGCGNVGPTAGNLGHPRGLAMLHLEPTTLSCSAELYRWTEDNDVTGVAAVHDNQFYVVGHYHGAQLLTLPESDDGGFLLKMQPTPVWNKTYDGDGQDDVRDVTLTDENDLVVVGGITEGTTLDEIPTPNSRAAMVARYDPAGTTLWGQLLSTNAGSDAVASAVTMYGESVNVVGSFSGTSRIFNENLRLDAIGDRDLFFATLDGATGEVTGASNYGRNGRSIEATSIVINESAPIVAGHTTDDFETPFGEIDCRGGSESCSFILRLSNP
jgi:hypothetical protein